MANRSIKGVSISFSFGAWCGFSFYRDYTTRICMGWVSVVVWPFNLDHWVAEVTKKVVD